MKAYGGETYIFRADISYRSTQTVKTELELFGREDQRQPFYGTYVLAQPNTNYVLIKVTPKSDTDDLMIKNYSNALGYDTYQVYKVNDYGEPELLVDNSKLYPVDEDWSVSRSCTTVEK